MTQNRLFYFDIFSSCIWHLFFVTPPLTVRVFVVAKLVFFVWMKSFIWFSHAHRKATADSVKCSVKGQCSPEFYLYRGASRRAWRHAGMSAALSHHTIIANDAMKHNTCIAVLRVKVKHHGQRREGKRLDCIVRRREIGCQLSVYFGERSYLMIFVWGTGSKKSITLNDSNCSDDTAAVCRKRRVVHSWRVKRSSWSQIFQHLFGQRGFQWMAAVFVFASLFCPHIQQFRDAWLYHVGFGGNRPGRQVMAACKGRAVCPQ